MFLYCSLTKIGEITAENGELSAFDGNCRKPIREDKGNSYASWMLTNVRLIMEVITLGFKSGNGCNCHPVGLLGLTSTDYDNFLRPQNRLTVRLVELMVNKSLLGIELNVYMGYNEEVKI